MSTVDISSLSVAELQKLKGNIDDAIANRRQGELAGLRLQIEELVTQSGFSLDEVMQAKAPKKRIVQPKYADPNNPEQTWSGRGRKPAWVQELLDSGAKLEDFTV